ncbi:Crotonobetainyl-CoA:carnitine CoA-transferase CaiB [Colletotrichum sp. SAR 10_70]|nr:Crotonobetainyl-CoA:carnitine CoA-transferase CaiB [Colletotrichum sp. SAR 10_71]KAI8165790.1 Crotonobetainyl-CoA:carnitine CoA-transferase CaiB [Colletotrichum sp. SAR 10_70]
MTTLENFEDCQGQTKVDDPAEEYRCDAENAGSAGLRKAARQSRRFHGPKKLLILDSGEVTSAYNGHKKDFHSILNILAVYSGSKIGGKPLSSIEIPRTQLKLEKSFYARNALKYTVSEAMGLVPIAELMLKSGVNLAYCQYENRQKQRAERGQRLRSNKTGKETRADAAMNDFLKEVFAIKFTSDEKLGQVVTLQTDQKVFDISKSNLREALQKYEDIQEEKTAEQKQT